MSASRISNKVLHRLLYSDELASYPNSSLIRKFSKTWSKYQVLSSTPQTDEGILAPQEKTAGASSVLRDPQSSNQRAAASGKGIGYIDDGGNDPGTPLKVKDGQNGESQSGTHGAKRSNQKVSRAANMMA